MARSINIHLGIKNLPHTKKLNLISVSIVFAKLNLFLHALLFIARTFVLSTSVYIITLNAVQCTVYNTRPQNIET